MSDLAGLLSKMTSSRDAFIQLINQLLHEIRALRQSSQSSTSVIQSGFNAWLITDISKIPSSSPTLSNLLADQPRGKRKRSITHFDGIPILAITPPTPRSDWRGRKVVYRKKVMALDWQMDKLRVVGSGSTIGTSESVCPSSLYPALAYEERQAYEADDESDEDDDMMIVI